MRNWSIVLKVPQKGYKLSTPFIPRVEEDNASLESCLRWSCGNTGLPGVNRWRYQGLVKPAQSEFFHNRQHPSLEGFEV